MRQIVVAFERQSNCDRLREALESTGEFTCLTCRSAAQVKRAVAKLRLDLVVCGFKLADEDVLRRRQAMKIFELIMARKGLESIGWRERTWTPSCAASRPGP